MPFDPQPRRDERPDDTCPVCGKPIVAIVGPIAGVAVHMQGPPGMSPVPVELRVFIAKHLDGTECPIVRRHEGGT